MAGRKSDFTLTKLDDLFSTQEQRDEEKLSKIRDIPLTEIDDFPDHPFKVRDDEDMAQLIESIKERGVITPATVRQKEDGRYELISGHRRKRACELAGFDTLRCEVVDLNRDEATILMVESNYQRSQILPSEKAYAYKMRLEAMKRQGERTDLTCDPLGDKLVGTKSVMLLADKSDDSKTQIQRYIRLTNLVPELLEYVDEDNLVEGVTFHLYGTSLSGISVDEYAVTDKNGVATFKDVLISGTTPYTIEEMDTAIRYVVPANQTAPVKWKEVTTRNFTNILKKFTVTVTKSDREEGSAQGGATLAGAVYGIYKGETLVDKYVTDKNGQFTTKEYVCDNDWTIREITPSEGYLLDTTIHKVGAEPQLYTVEHNQTANDVNEQVIKGNIAIIKHTDDGETKIETPESGATFEIYLKSAGNYTASEEDERDIIVCDENGFGQTKDMPYGVYTVHQTSGWEGRELMKDFDVFIAQNGQTYRYLINNANFESYIKVVKVDAESGKTIPYAGAGFQIYDPTGNLVTMSFIYPTPTTIDTFYTDANGCLVTPEKLEYGKGYSLVEVQAPYGYVLDSTPVYFDVTQDNATEESGVTVIKVDKPNMAQKGTITVEKTGEVFYGVSVSGSEDTEVIYQPIFEIAGLSGAVYEIRTAEDIITPDGTVRFTKGEVVDTVTTGEDGLAKSRELYLGKYEVKEIKAPYGMVLNDEIHTAELVYAGQNVSVTETATSFVNERQKVEISLKKTLEASNLFGIGQNGEMKNISFGLFAAEELVSASGTSIPADGLIEIVTLLHSFL